MVIKTKYITTKYIEIHCNDQRIEVKLDDLGNGKIEREIKDASNYDAHGVEEDIENDLDDGEIEGVIHILNEDGDPIMTDLKPIIIANWEVKEEEEECY